ncbi:cbb3-type cytochrome c oxidase subunit III [Roseibium hamelinense]|uniref:Cbb3-type cytochrome c oxidase subunit III n=1 Tax=Roseibium hamelinense TaxID=150831 RepID=A0A562TBS5_9HYPH|nr:cytochrome c [Roseibium hamelinense]MTI45135.1 c-type cytochrome [Roseibium hamelinense]TWI90506.1 cbb3-type cytochrome c oxidase subunit III [Roseibium hamelinense]
MRHAALALTISAIFSSSALASGSPYPSDAASLASGREIAEIHCATCHAVSESDVSAQDGAPAFRDLSQRYPLETLEESLAEGIVTGHDGMPEFAFAPEDIDAFLGYLTSIQSQ